MNSERLKVIAPIIILMAAIVIAALVIMARPEVVQKTTAPIRPLIDIVQVSKQTVAIPIDVQGNVQARTETQLIADVSGRVIWVSDEFRVGNYFTEGAELARIDDRNYVGAVKRAEAAIASAKSALASEKGRADVALKEWQQRGKNVKRSAAATDLYLRKPQTAEANARLESAKADLQQAKADLEHTIVRAPYNAMVRQKSIDLGQSIAPGAMIGKVFAIDRAEVVVPLPEKQLQFINLPNSFASDQQHYPKVELTGTGSLASQRWQGRLVRTEGVLDQKTRSMTAIVEVADPYGLLGNNQHLNDPLRIGAYVKARIDGKPLSGLIELSQAAINPGNKVWVVNAENRLEQRTVEIRLRTAENAYVSAGLSDGDRVSITGVSSFVTGAEVRIASINGVAAKEQLQLSADTAADTSTVESAIEAGLGAQAAP